MNNTDFRKQKGLIILFGSTAVFSLANIISHSLSYKPKFLSLLSAGATITFLVGLIDLFRKHKSLDSSFSNNKYRGAAGKLILAAFIAYAVILTYGDFETFIILWACGFGFVISGISSIKNKYIKVGVGLIMIGFYLFMFYRSLGFIIYSLAL